MNTGIYKYFRDEYAVYGDVFKPTGPNKNKKFISLCKRHEFQWQDLSGYGKIYIIEI